VPQNLHEIPKKFHRQNLERFIDKYGNWTEIQTYYNSLKEFEFKVAKRAERIQQMQMHLSILRKNYRKLYINYDDNAIKSSFASINNQPERFSIFI
jgi:hypothetical protein